MSYVVYWLTQVWTGGLTSELRAQSGAGWRWSTPVPGQGMPQACQNGRYVTVNRGRGRRGDQGTGSVTEPQVRQGLERLSL